MTQLSNNISTLKVLDLFSGIGGFSYGLEKTGKFKTELFCEIDKDCQKVLKKHWPLVSIENDITSLSLKEGSYDIVCGGFPCQDLSIAGKKTGLKGERSGLWREYARIINEVKPKFVIIENVGNLRKLGLNTVLSDLARIGYDAEWYTIRATDVGLPHQRERLYIISYPSKQRLNEYTGEERFISSDQKRKNTETYPERKECQSQSIKVCPILSRRIFEDYRNTLSDQRTLVSSVRRVTNGIPEGLYEADRKRRIKQLGNSIVPHIAEIIGNEIIKRIGIRND